MSGASDTRIVLERVSRMVEAHPGMDERSIRRRAGVPRQSGSQALELLVRAGFLQRDSVDAEWHYRSLKPYRAADFAPRADYGATHSVGQGGEG